MELSSNRARSAALGPKPARRRRCSTCQLPLAMDRLGRSHLMARGSRCKQRNVDGRLHFSWVKPGNSRNWSDQSEFAAKLGKERGDQAPDHLSLCLTWRQTRSDLTNSANFQVLPTKSVSARRHFAVCSGSPEP